MSLLCKVDGWIGRTLFIPIIIRICQKTGVSQHFFANQCSMVVAFILLWLFGPDHWGFLVWFGFLVFTEVLIAGLMPDIEIKPQGPRIRMFLVFLWLSVCAITVFGVPLLGHVLYFLLLLGDYAREIDTIPPLEVEEKEPEGRLAEQEA